jgi:hypothetical protein
MMRQAGVTLCGGLTLMGIFWSIASSESARLLVSASSPPPEINRCADCHGELVAQFKASPHFNCLSRIDATTLERFAGQTSNRAKRDEAERFVNHDGELWANAAGTSDSLQVDWIFGSGRHAQTPVSILSAPNGRLELIEHKVSWYLGTGLGPTFGQLESRVSHAGLRSFGNHLRSGDAHECFTCHTSNLGNLDRRSSSRTPHDVVTGVGCIRCHVRAADHLDSIKTGTLSLDRWSELSPIDSINRCGECHRRSDHFTVDELVPHNQLLVRFAPVGLSQSACFKSQTDIRHSDSNTQTLICTSCHNPHTVNQDHTLVTSKVCQRCHTSPESVTAGCQSQHPDSNCITCHMPKVAVNGQLSFTDHWIRVHQPDEHDAHP